MNGILHFQQLDSTNAYLAQLLQRKNHAKGEALPDGMAVLADYQTAGRGRQTNCWHSKRAKNLLMSILVFPDIPVAEQFRVTEWISVALADHLHQDVGLESCIKWPNDIYIGDRKIAGILISHHWSGTDIDSSIIGIGLNLNENNFPTHLPNPTSVIIETGKRSVPADTAAVILARLSETRKEEPSKLHERYLRLLYRRNRTATYLDIGTGSCFEGEIIGVTTQGLLEIRCGSTTRHFALNEIAYR